VQKPSSTVSHVLSACKVALSQGRYTYRHDSVLKNIVKSIKEFLFSYVPHPSEELSIRFMKEEKNAMVGMVAIF